MKHLLLVIAVVLLLACGSVRQTNYTPEPTKQPTPTIDKMLGYVETLMFSFEHQYQFRCGAHTDHWRCLGPSGIKVVFFNDPVDEAFISIPFEAADLKPSKYVVGFLAELDLVDSWDWLVSQMKKPEASKVFGDKRLTSQMDDEGWLVTVEAVR